MFRETIVLLSILVLLQSSKYLQVDNRNWGVSQILLIRKEINNNRKHCKMKWSILCSGDAIRCYECSSITSPSCADKFSNMTTRSVDCSQQQIYDLTPVEFCRKIKYKGNITILFTLVQPDKNRYFVHSRQWPMDLPARLPC